MITHVDGQATRAMTLAEITRKLKQPNGTRVQLILRRGQEQVDATLQLRDLAG